LTSQKCSKCGAFLSFMNHEQLRKHDSECGSSSSSANYSKPIHQGRKGRFG